jgi:hypothetical protein
MQPLLQLHVLLLHLAGDQVQPSHLLLITQRAMPSQLLLLLLPCSSTGLCCVL